jgi:rhamnosyltransferase
LNVSVVIPTRNAEQYIQDLLDKLCSQNVTVREIIIIDTDSEDRTVEMCSKYDRVKIIKIKQSEFDHGGTRNLGARSSSGDYIVFLTQDAIPENESFIEKLLKPFNDPRIAAVYGRQIAREDAHPIEKFAREFNYPKHDILKSKKDINNLGIKTFFFTDVCSAFRNSDFEAVGGFPENVIMNEDMIIASKLILSDRMIGYAWEAAVLHSHDYTLRQVFGRYFDIGVSIRMHDYILKYAKAEAEGGKFMKEAAKRLIKSRNYLGLCKLLTESVCKFVGYKLGISYKVLPTRVARRFSMHKFFWDRNCLIS